MKGKKRPADTAANWPHTPGYRAMLAWFRARQWQPFPFQEETWQAFLDGKNGLLNAPTGSGKTFALFAPVLIDWINQHPNDYKTKTNNGLKLLWITPLRALTRDIQKALQGLATDLELPWQVKARTGDTSAYEKQVLKKKLPEVLITTPESLHIMLATKEYPKIFTGITAIVVDEWHELLGSKRGVQVELALSRIRTLNGSFRAWGVSATIGNLNQALQVLLGAGYTERPTTLVKADIEKQLHIKSILPQEVERFPWAGHLGLKLLPEILPIIRESRSTLVFINTRGMTEVWYKSLLEQAPDLAGQMALHHGSLDREVRDWVEDALHEGTMKVVICTSSLDLGVDFAPVETVIQVGSPKGVNRFLQRAGRSGHRPGAASVIYFLPTNALELAEAAALKEAVSRSVFEERLPMYKPIDVLLQYLMTLAISDGFQENVTWQEVTGTYTYRDLTREEWEWCLDFLTTGGDTLQEYDEFRKLHHYQGLYYPATRQAAIRHRMNIGTIVSDTMMRLQMMKGSSLGSVEESFISRMKPGDIFWFGGRSLELVSVKEMTAYVRKATVHKGIIPSWQGARMSLSTQLSDMLRLKLTQYVNGIVNDPEIEALRPLLDLQQRWSTIPQEDMLLIERTKTGEGYHLFFFPFAGRAIHEGLAALIAFRIAQRQPITFSIAMNDYGFELLSETEPDLEGALENGLFGTEYLHEEMVQSVNGTEMARRRFRDIAQIAGLIFTGYPGKMKRNKHLQASSGLLFDVFKQYDPTNLLLAQAYEEVYRYLLDENRLRRVLESLAAGKLVIRHTERPTPFAFPILVDRMREKISSEKLLDRIARLQLELENEADEFNDH